MLRPARAVLFLASCALAGLSVLGLAANPLVLPFVQLSATEARLGLERVMARTVDGRWLLPRLETAVNEEEVDRAELLLSLAADHGVAVPHDLSERARDVVASGSPASIARCAACAYDVAECRSVPQIVACALPVELTPLGDANALRRQTMTWAQGDEVDQLEAGLALVGLGASALVLFTGGSSATIKGGATAIRVMRRSGQLTPRFSRHLAEAADIPVAWDRVGAYVVGRADLSDVTDVSRLARLGAAGRDLGTVARNTSVSDSLALLRHVDGPEDLADMARLSDMAGDATRRTVETLGLARALRTLTRLSDIVIALSGLVIGLITYLSGILAARALGMLRRRLPRD